MNKIKKYTKELLVLALMIFVISNVMSYYRSLELNKQNFDLKNLKLIDDFNYTYPKGEALMLHFWATWCPVCKVEKPNIQEVSKTYNVLSISTDSGSNEQVLKFVLDNDIKFDVVNDSDYKLAKKFNIQVFPTTLIYDKTGKLVFSEVGYTSTLGLKIRMWWANL